MGVWMDIACIVFTCVTMNHLGLVKAIEDFVHLKLKVVNCVKCFSFWSVLSYSVYSSHDVITSLAVSILSSYVAIWVELFEGFIDSLYMKGYEKVYTDTGNDTTATDTNIGDTASPVP